MKRLLTPTASLLGLQLILISGLAACSKGPDNKPSEAPTAQSPSTPEQPKNPEPAPSPQPQPDPKPQPAPEPQPPVPLPPPKPPIPQPVPLPRPRPPQAPKPSPAPAPAPKPQPKPEPKPEPKPVPQPLPEPAPGKLPPADPSVGAPAWGTSGERRLWTQAVRAVAFGRLRDLERAEDKEVFCPGYSRANLNQRLNCWVLLVAAVSEFESAFKAGDSFREPDGNYSVGLLALSPNECPNAHTIAQLEQAVPNLVCGTNRMAALIAHDGYIDGPASRRGASSYWSTLRAPYKEWDASRGRYLSLGKKNQILPLVRGYRGHVVVPQDKGKSQALHSRKLKDAMAIAGGELMSCGAVEQMVTDDATGQQKLMPIDLEVTLESSDEVPSGVVAQVRSHGNVHTEKDARVVTVAPNDAGQAIDIARSMFPDRDFSGVQSVRVGDVGVAANQHDSAGIMLYELLGPNERSLAKVLTIGWSFARCGR